MEEAGSHQRMASRSLRKRSDRLFSRGRIAGPNEDQGHHGFADPLQRHERRRWRERHCGTDAEFIGSLGGDLIHPSEHGGAILDWPRDRSSQDHGPNRVQPILESRRDPEIPSATAQPPEQLGLGVRVNVEALSVRGNEVDGRAGCRR